MKRFLFVALPLLLAAGIFVYLRQSAGPAAAGAPPSATGAPELVTFDSAVLAPLRDTTAGAPGAPSSLHRPGPAAAPVAAPSTPGTVTGDPDRPLALRAGQGTVVWMPANSLVLESTGKPPQTPVTLRVHEYFSASDILQADLGTTAQGRLLETGGMLYVSAASAEGTCRLRKGAGYEITFPGRRPDDDMQLFTGQVQNGRVDWVLQPLVSDLRFEYAKARQSNRYHLPRFMQAQDLREFLARKLRWPDTVDAPITMWDVQLHYTINENGKVVNARVDNSMASGFDSLFQKVALNMPRWTPAGLDEYRACAELTQQVTYWWESNTWRDTAVRIRVSTARVDSIYFAQGQLPPASLTFTARSLGWINCDRFYNDPGEKANLYVETGDKPADVKLLFHDIRSIMNGDRGTDGGPVFQNIPAEKTVTIIAVRKEAENQYAVALQEASTSAGTVKILSYVKTDREGLLRKLQELDHRFAAAPQAVRPAQLPGPTRAAGLSATCYGTAGSGSFPTSPARNRPY
ncbi:MAG: hypothetical protein EOO16_21890, partial [Chitinophagaceae bacterium]